ncbi:hypothetical protein DSM106972_059160 [Dulcicalothrix desertica PCC 7102]|uniref:HicB-like antitoxin of toxin-antitoxin system domain-containing protein n=1 Tax=Dulcicalothrix desertica PCC 7102 TaxID=232991 RepID=A0A3S1C8R5_9CYAN|nr:type II toxin-antitoxin system HicB family antitoxin [Dulcicalothrix desertica]RUT02438.1 hypothetical protein DSM106972_059160 [Dulcicalothrix desertica PCC 7102]TWH55344.1 putative RNase H-like HicB family nuclease [Dulcicalothrix desertica PCC 7102]
MVKSPTSHFIVVIEKGSTSYGAYVTNLPGCIAVGETREEVLKLIKEGIELQLEDLGVYREKYSCTLWRSLSSP